MLNPKIFAAPAATVSLFLILAGCTPKEEPKKTETAPPATMQTETKPSPPAPAAKEPAKPATPVTEPAPPKTEVAATQPAPPEEKPAPPAAEPPAMPVGNITSGQRIFGNTCQSCHGKNGDAGNQGGMKNAANFANIEANPPRIRDILSHLTAADHAKIIKMGGAKSGVKGAMAAMPAFGSVLNDQQIADVMAYERSLPAFKNSPK